MGKHGSGRQPLRPWPVVLTVAALAAVIGLGWWWWSLRAPVDPIAANPVQAYGAIVASDPCTAAGATSTVRFNTPDGYVTAPLHVCGYQPGQNILVEYLGTDPALVRPESAAVEEPAVLRRMLPALILVAGVLGAAALLAFVRGPRSAHRAVAQRRLSASTPDPEPTADTAGSDAASDSAAVSADASATAVPAAPSDPDRSAASSG